MYITIVYKQSFFRKWTPLLVLSIALMIIILDTTILNVSLRTIINDLHTDIQSIQWVITAYSLILAAFTITGGRLGDLFGRKKMFVAGAVIFAIGSFITSISPNVAIMIAGEAIIEGIGAALMIPATASLLVNNYEGRDRQIGFGIWGGIAAAAAALGPVVGGWLTTYYSWRWAFRINVFVAAVLVMGSYLISEVRNHEPKPELDFGGIALSATGLFFIVFGFIKAETYGWFKAKEAFTLFGQKIQFGDLSIVPIFILLGLILLGLFALWEYQVTRQGRTPLVTLSIFRNKNFIVPATITAIVSLSLSGLTFSLPVFLQAVKNLNALQTGIAMLPLSLTLLFASPLSAYVSKFISPKWLIQLGLVLNALGLLLLRSGLGVSINLWALTPGFAVFGMGIGILISQTNNMSLSAVPVRESGEASGVNNTFRQLGITLGAAILGSILISSLTTNLVSGVSNSSQIPPALKTPISKNISSQASNVEFSNSTPAVARKLPASITHEIESISHQSIVDASRTTLGFGIYFILLALIISIGLPSGKTIEAQRPAEDEERKRSLTPEYSQA